MTKRPQTEAMPRPAGRETVITLHSVRIACSAGPDAGREWTVDRPSVSIGSGDDADLVLTDLAVSGTHVAFEIGPKGWAIRDLESRNGTELDGVPIKSAFLRRGSRVRIGRTTLTIEPVAESVHARLSTAGRFQDVLGSSTAMQRIFGVLEKVAERNATIVLTGPTGAGKGALARAIHAASPRADKPFVVLDCGSVDSNLIVAELFGHTRGAFTGATDARPGVFEAAQGGTVFIDEVGEMPLDLQPKLLRVLDERRVVRLGSHQPVPVDVRVIAATHRDLRRMVAIGEFREDLYYRLAVVELEVPPLAARRSDVPVLADHFLEAQGASSQRPLSAAALEALLAHSWPGNVRELRNVIERAIALAGSDPITPEHIRTAPMPASVDTTTARKVSDAGPPQAATFAALEKETLVRVLAKHGGNRTRAAQELGVALTTLRRRMRKHKLE